MAKKILMTTMSLDIGGAETHIAELCRALSQDGYAVTVASAGGVYEDLLRRAGVRHVTLPLAGKRPKQVLAAYRGLYRLIREEKFDVVHAHARIPAFICGILAKRLRFRFVTTAHGTFSVAPPWKLISNWGEKTLAVSYDIKDYLIRNYHLPHDNIALTVNGIDTRRFCPEGAAEDVVREFSLPASDHRVLYVARLDRFYSVGIRSLLLAAESLCRTFADFQLVIVGDGDDAEAIRAEADRINAAARRPVITMTGRRTDVEKFCAWAQVAVGVSRSILEAMSAGCLAVLSGAQGALGILDASTLPAALETNFTCRGYRCANSARIRRDLLTLFSMSEREREEMRAFNRKVVEEHYSIRRMAEDAERLYASLPPVRPDGGKIVISGYYGFSNLGDDSLLQVILEQMRDRYPQAEYCVLSRRPAATARTYLVDSVRRFSPFAVRRALKGAKLLVFGGGSQLQSVTSSRSLTYYLFLLRTARKMGVRTALLANGLGPFSTQKDCDRVAKELSATDLITLRDSGSLEKLREVGVTHDRVLLAADPAFLMRPADAGWCAHLLRAAGVEPGTPYFAVNLRTWRNLDRQAESRIADFCVRLSAKTGWKPVFISMHAEKDLDLCSAAARRCNGALLYDLSPAECRTVVGGAQLVCAMRLHLLIYAVSAAVPVLGLSYDPKIDAFFSDIGRPDCLSASDLSAGRLLDLANRAMASDRESLRAVSRAFCQRAGIGMEKIRPLLEEN